MPDNTIEQRLDDYLKNSEWSVTLFAGHRDVLVKEVAKFIAQEANKAVVAELAKLTNHDNYISDAHLGQVVSVKTIENRIAQLTAEKGSNNG